MCDFKRDCLNHGRTGCDPVRNSNDCLIRAVKIPQAAPEAGSECMNLLSCPVCEKLKAALSIAIQYLPIEGEEGYSEDVYKEVAEVHEIIKQAT